jgi:hypothetical protein
MYSPKRRLKLFRDPAWTGGGEDKIAQSLTANLATYTAAADGDWVKITSGEYAAVRTNVTGINVAGATDATLAAIGINTNFTSGSLMFTNIVSSASPMIPANSYVFAVSLYTGANLSSVKVYANDSTSSYTNFVQIGGTLPLTTSGTLSYYVLKGAETPTAVTDGNFAMHSTSNIVHGFKQNVGAAGIRYTSTGTPTPSSALNSSFGTGTAAAFSLQALTTTSKQW